MKKGFLSSPVRVVVACLCILMPLMALWVTMRRRPSPDDHTGHSRERRGVDSYPDAPPLALKEDSVADPSSAGRLVRGDVAEWHVLDTPDLAYDATPEAIHALLLAWGLQARVEKGEVRVGIGEVEHARLALRLADLDETGTAWTLSDVTVTAEADPRLHRLQTWLAGRDTLTRMLPLALGVEGLRIRVEPSADPHTDPYAACIVRIVMPTPAGLSESDRLRLRQHVQSLLSPVGEIHVEMQTRSDTDDGSAAMPDEG